jgi:hypothetical protein
MKCLRHREWRFPSASPPITESSAPKIRRTSEKSMKEETAQLATDFTHKIAIQQCKFSNHSLIRIQIEKLPYAKESALKSQS